MDRTYSSSKPAVYLNAGLAPLLAVLFVALTIYAAIEVGKRGGSHMPILAAAIVVAVILGILAPIAYVSLRTASQIRVRDDGVIEFRGLWLKTSLSPSAIASIRASPWIRSSWVNVKHTGGRFGVYVPVDGFYEFLGWLKEKNPNVEIRWL